MLTFYNYTAKKSKGELIWRFIVRNGVDVPSGKICEYTLKVNDYKYVFDVGLQLSR